MKMDKQKFAVAASAVFAYIKTSEEAAAWAAAREQAPVMPDRKPEPQAAFNHWGFTGRSSQMQANDMIRLRAFK